MLYTFAMIISEKQMKSVDITIVIPTYKGMDNILLSVKSAILQTVQSKEIIVVDDNGLGTPEQIETKRVLKKYIDGGEIVYICHPENRNGSAARNTGLSYCHGRFITFLDDDDYIYPEKLEAQIKSTAQASGDIGMYISNGYYVDANGKGFASTMRQDKRKDFLFNYLMDKNFFNTSAIMFDTKKLKSIGGFDETYRRHQDWETCVRMLSKFEAFVNEQPFIVKYSIGRNDPKGFETPKKYLEYFLNRCIFQSATALTNKQKDTVAAYKRRRIAVSLIKQGQFHDAIRWCMEYGGMAEVIRTVFYLARIPLTGRLSKKGVTIDSLEEMYKKLHD